jgi:hypothetical protein
MTPVEAWEEKYDIYHEYVVGLARNDVFLLTMCSGTFLLKSMTLIALTFTIVSHPILS